MLVDQMDGKRFPIRLEDTNACLRRFPAEKIVEQQEMGNRVRRIRANHPGITFGFRAELSDARLVYLPDNELFPPDGDLQQTAFEEFVAFCQGVDVLIHDAQYTEADMPLKYGWGHSVISQVRELAAAAQVKHLVLFHHDPDRTDDELDAIQAESDDWFRKNAPQTRCTVAYEGLSLTIPG
jgi:ribonuclease BN (tRNA processing enzyme)